MLLTWDALQQIQTGKAENLLKMFKLKFQREHNMNTFSRCNEYRQIGRFSYFLTAPSSQQNKIKSTGFATHTAARDREVKGLFK